MTTTQEVQQPDLPEWKCHKVVQAFLIAGWQSLPHVGDDDVMLHGYLHGIEYAAQVTRKYVTRVYPDGDPGQLIGGYYVRYEDGYESWSPREAFDQGYTLIQSPEDAHARMLLGGLQAQQEAGGYNEEYLVRFSHHAPSSPEIAAGHDLTRSRCLDLALIFDSMLPSGREKSLVMTHLELVCMYANAAIARSQMVNLPDDFALDEDKA